MNKINLGPATIQVLRMICKQFNKIWMKKKASNMDVFVDYFCVFCFMLCEPIFCGDVSCINVMFHFHSGHRSCCRKIFFIHGDTSR